MRILFLEILFFNSVRQVIPVIRGNDTSGTPNINTNIMRKKRSADDEELFDSEFFKRPDAAKKTDRALRRVPDDVRQSRVLNKKLRLLRMFNLKEDESHEEKSHEKHKKHKKVVPRVSHPYHLGSKTNRKMSFVPKYGFISIISSLT